MKTLEIMMLRVTNVEVKPYLLLLFIIVVSIGQSYGQTKTDLEIFTLVKSENPNIDISAKTYTSEDESASLVFQIIADFIYSDLIKTNAFDEWKEKLSKKEFFENFSPNEKWGSFYWYNEFENRTNTIFQISRPFYSKTNKSAIVYTRNVPTCGWYSAILIIKKGESWKHLTTANLIPDLQLPKDTCVSN